MNRQMQRKRIEEENKPVIEEVEVEVEEVITPEPVIEVIEPIAEKQEMPKGSISKFFKRFRRKK